MDILTQAERNLIDRAVDAGQVTKVPTGESGFGEFFYHPEQQKLRYRDPEERKRHHKAWGWQNHYKAGRKPDPEVSKRRVKLREIAHEFTVFELAEKFGATVPAIRADLKLIGIHAKSARGRNGRER